MSGANFALATSVVDIQGINNFTNMSLSQIEK